MSFAKDILGLPKKNAESGFAGTAPGKALAAGGIGVVPSGSPPNPVKRLDGLSRELLQLTGGIGPVHTIAPTAAFKEKPQQKVSWHLKGFENSARKDKLVLKTFTKEDSEGDYAFAKFNRKVKIVEYSEEDYKTLLSSLQPAPKKTEKDGKGFEQWTKEETDHLFQLCLNFDLRFVVIHDRWPEKYKTRSVDDLKDRYYSVARKLIEAREKAKQPPPVGAFQKHCSAISSNPFDIEYEILRKQQLEGQYTMSKGELRQEEETVREARRIEANRKRLLKERQRIQKLLLPIGDISVPEPEESVTVKASKSSKGKTAIPGTVEPVLTLPTKSFQHRKAWNCAHARSSFIYQSVKQSARLAKRVEIMLDELQVGLRPMATASIVDAYDLLRVEILAHIELQRTVSRKEEEVHLSRVKLAKLKGETPPTPPPGVHLSHKKRKHDDVFERGLSSGFNTAVSSPTLPTTPQTPLQKRRKKY